MGRCQHRSDDRAGNCSSGYVVTQQGDDGNTVNIKQQDRITGFGEDRITLNETSAEIGCRGLSMNLGLHYQCWGDDN